MSKKDYEAAAKERREDRMVATQELRRNGARFHGSRFIDNCAYASDLNWVPGYFPTSIIVEYGGHSEIFARVELLDDHATYQRGGRVLTVFND